MFVRLVVLLALTFSLNTALSAQQHERGVRVVRASAVLDEPRGEAKVVATVRPGEILEVLDSRDGWYLVRPPEATRTWATGWIAAQMVTPIEATDAGLRPAQPATGPPAGGTGARAPSPRRAWLSTGYLFSRDFESELNFPYGVYGDFSVNVTPTFGFVAEASWIHKDESFLGIDLGLDQTAVLGGIRIASTDSTSPYAQALVGVIVPNVTTRVFGQSVAVSNPQWATQIGGGIRVGRSVAVRAGADYTYSPGFHYIRVLVGVAFGIGGM